MFGGNGHVPSPTQKAKFDAQCAANKSFMDKDGPKQGKKRSYGEGAAPREDQRRFSSGRGGARKFSRKSRGRGGRTTLEGINVITPRATLPDDCMFVCGECQPATLIVNQVNISVRLPKGAAEDVEIKTTAMLDTGANTRNYIDATLAKQLIDAGAVASSVPGKKVFRK